MCQGTCCAPVARAHGHDPPGSSNRRVQSRPWRGFQFRRAYNRSGASPRQAQARQTRNRHHPCHRLRRRRPHFICLDPRRVWQAAALARPPAPASGWPGTSLRGSRNNWARLRLTGHAYSGQTLGRLESRGRLPACYPARVRQAIHRKKARVATRITTVDGRFLN